MASVAQTAWQSLGRRGRMLVGGVALFLIVAALSGGCYAHRDPPANPADSGGARSMPLPFAVKVVPWGADAADQRDPNAYAKSLAALLDHSKAFKQAGLDAPNAELVAVSTGLICESSVIPVFTIVTAGIIPTVFDGERCDGLILRSSKAGAAPPVEIRVREKGQVVIGWAALVFGLLPGWSYGVVGDDATYAGRVRGEIARVSPAVEALATQKDPPPTAAAAPAPGSAPAPALPPLPVLPQSDPAQIRPQ